MPWFNLGSESRGAKPRLTHAFDEADRVVAEVFADLYEAQADVTQPSTV